MTPIHDATTLVSINDLPIEGSNSEGNGRRVVTRHLPAHAQVVTTYPRPNSGLDEETKFRIASLAKKSLAHLGYANDELNDFVSNLADHAGIENSE